jgi:hypothetical protein
MFLILARLNVAPFIFSLSCVTCMDAPERTGLAAAAAAAHVPLVGAMDGAVGDDKSDGREAAGKMVVYERRWKVEPASDDASKFAETADFYCIMCGEIVWKPLLCGGCGKLSCSGCIDEWVKAGKKGGRECPHCRGRPPTIALASVETNTAVKKMLGKLQVKCAGYAYAEAGCGWTGDYFDAEQHVENRCQFSTLRCAHCTKEMCRRDHAAHAEACPQKPIACPDCKQGAFAPGAAMDAHRKTQCLRAAMACPDCKWTGPRAEQAPHIATCQDAKLICEIPGCLVQTPRRHMLAHLSQNALHHVQLLLKQNKALIAAAAVSEAARHKRKPESAGGRTSAKRRKRSSPDILSVSESESESESDSDSESDTDAAVVAPKRPPHPGWLACTSLPECTFGGWYDPKNPYGQRCRECNTARRRHTAKVPCDLKSSSRCWQNVYPHPRFGATCQPCRDEA